MAEEMDRFDVDYQAAKNEIRENLSFLENEFDMMAILAWISRLEEAACSPEEKAVRNEYTKYLAHQLSRQTLHYPFTEDPPQGQLPPLCVSMDNPLCGENMCRYKKSNSEEKLPKRRPCESPRPTRGNILSHQTEEDPCSVKSSFSEWPIQGPAPTPAASPPRKSRCGRRRREQPSPSTQPPCRPCEPCPQEPETRRQTRRHCPSQPCHFDNRPCPVDPPPPRLPPGYLSKTSEEDESPFSPPLPCTEENQSRLEQIVEAVDEETELYEFINEVSPFSCDLGETMQVVTSEELTHFKEFVRSVYQSRMADTQDLLTKEHIKLKERYDEWEANVLRQAQGALRALKLMLPLFRYDSYKRDPEYLYYMLRNQMSLEKTDANPQARILRAKAQKKTWLNEEAQRIEKDNMDRTIQMRELNAQLAALSKSYNASHKRLTDTNKCLEDQAAQLRIRHDENQKLIDHLIDQLNTPPRTY